MTDIQAFKRQIQPFLAPDVKAMGAVSIRFSGKNRKHIGKDVILALDKALAQFTGPLHLVGRVPKNGRASHIKTAKLWDKKGREILHEVLNNTSTIGSGWDQQIIFYIKDGDPLQNGIGSPERFALFGGLCKEDFSGGYLALAFPLEDLAMPNKWFQVIENMIEDLGAEVASLSPALWSAPQMPLFYDSDILKNENSQKVLADYFIKFPQVTFPLYECAGHTVPPDGILPDVFSGFLYPTWVMWAKKELANRVKSFAGKKIVLPSGAARFEISTSQPFKMTANEYRKWAKAWDSMRSLHLRFMHKDSQESSPYLSRFNKPTLRVIVAKKVPIPKPASNGKNSLSKLDALLEKAKDSKNHSDWQRAAEMAMQQNDRAVALKILEKILKEGIWPYGLYGEYGLIGTKHLKKLKSDINFKILVNKYYK